MLNAKLLGSMVSRMPSGQINIQSTENGKTTIQSGVAQFEIQSMNPTVFPELPNTGGAGTTLYTKGGVLLTASAMLLLLYYHTKRRKEKSASS